MVEADARPLPRQIRRGDVQALVDRLRGRGLSAGKVRNIIVSLRVVYRHAIERELVETNPTSGVRLPNGGTPRDRAASVTEAAQLLAALPAEDRPLWATAFYAGLRRGELQALRWTDVDVAEGEIRVRRSYDAEAGEVEPKSEKGKRTVPVVALLRDYLAEHKAATGRDGDAFVFGRSANEPFTPTHIRERALAAWAAANAERKDKQLPPLEPIGLHEARHTCVSASSSSTPSRDERPRWSPSGPRSTPFASSRPSRPERGKQ